MLRAHVYIIQLHMHVPAYAQGVFHSEGGSEEDYISSIILYTTVIAPTLERTSSNKSTLLAVPVRLL